MRYLLCGIHSPVLSSNASRSRNSVNGCNLGFNLFVLARNFDVSVALVWKASDPLHFSGITLYCFNVTSTGNCRHTHQALVRSCYKFRLCILSLELLFYTVESKNMGHPRVSKVYDLFLTETRRLSCITSSLNLSFSSSNTLHEGNTFECSFNRLIFLRFPYDFPAKCILVSLAWFEHVLFSVKFLRQLRSRDVEMS